MSTVFAAALWPALLVALAVLLWPGGEPLGGRAAPREANPWRRRLQELGAREVQWPGRRREDSAAVADFAELASVGLDAGLSATAAARLAGEVGGASGPPWRDIGDAVARAETTGASLGEELGSAARDDRDLTFLAAAWRLTEEYGVAAAPAARTTATVVRERTAAAERRDVLMAGPRASMWLLTLLPLSGPLVAMLLGLPVGEVYGQSVALGATVVGLLLTGAGWWWSRRLLNRAARPAEVT